MTNPTITNPVAKVYRADLLVIDDTPENLQLLSQLLTERSYKVRSVTKGTTAIRAAQAVPPDLILLDINMPQMNGYEVCEQLKSDERTLGIPVIFISALGETLDKVRAFQVGGVDFVTKPFQVEEVLARIETHLQLRSLQVQLQQQNHQLQTEIRSRQQAETRFTKIFQTSPTPIATNTLKDGSFVEVNPSFERLSGYTHAELTGQRPIDLNLGLRPGAHALGLAELARTGAIHNREFELRTKSGEIRTVLLSVEPIELEGQPCTLTLVNDITERKRLENEFISLVSHELRTPISALVGALDLIATGKLGDLSEKGQQMIQVAINNAERLIRLVNDILDLERMKSGELTLHKKQCELSNLLTQATVAMQPMADQARVNLVTEPMNLQVWVDCDRIQQLLTNLLSNAIKFSPSGGTVWLRAAMTEAAGHNSPKPQLRFSVQDEGRGIPADKLTLIFERFQQVDASDARTKNGTGLGLSICRQIVQQYNGKIWVESTPGQGSTFYATLDVHSES
ncbi:MAG: ATP-binding protein [Cyanobacteria bacterium P01_A01_bin.123]